MNRPVHATERRLTGALGHDGPRRLGLSLLVHRRPVVDRHHDGVVVDPLKALALVVPDAHDSTLRGLVDRVDRIGLRTRRRTARTGRSISTGISVRSRSEMRQHCEGTHQRQLVVKLLIRPVAPGRPGRQSRADKSTARHEASSQTGHARDHRTAAQHSHRTTATEHHSWFMSPDRQACHLCRSARITFKMPHGARSMSCHSRSRNCSYRSSVIQDRRSATTTSSGYTELIYAASSALMIPHSPPVP